MDKIELELDKLWKDESFDEDNLSEIEEILLKKPSYVDFFVRKIDVNSSQIETLYLIVLNVVPLESCLQYALDKDDWLVEDFSEYGWFKGADLFSPMTQSEYRIWLTNQLILDGRG